MKPEIFSFLAARRLMKPGALVCPSQTDGKYFTKQSKGKQRKQTNKQRTLTKRIFIFVTNRWKVFHKTEEKESKMLLILGTNPWTKAWS